MRIFALPALLTLMTAAGFATAEDQPLPTNVIAPAVAYAKIFVTKEGKTEIALRRPQLVSVYKTGTKDVMVPVTQTVDGKAVTVNQKVTQTYTYVIQEATGWQTIRVPLNAPGVKIVDAALKPIKADQLADKIAKETPALVSVQDLPDQYHLLTTKSDTVILVVPQNILYPAPVGGIPRKEEAVAPKAMPVPAPSKLPKEMPIIPKS